MMRPSPPPRSLSPRQHAPRSTATPPRLLLWTAAGALLLLCALAAPAAASEPGRLGSDVVPVSQHTELHVDPAVPAYRGRVSIVLEAVTSAESFVLHAEGLEITSATLHRGRKRIPVTTAAQDHALLEVRPSKPLKPGTHRLDLDFTGELSDGTTGLYRFQSEDRWYVASQFEADEARRAFPCFDEPAAKATHRFSVSAPTGLTVVSNMPVVSTTEGELETAHHFATSPLLPTYVLALAIGPYESIPVGGMGRPSRVYTRAGRSGEAVELARLAPLVTEKLEIWFREKLPFPKMDFVALPAFDGSAMENAGAIFFHEKHVLFDPDTASRKKRAGLAQVLAHELAHQWFGNLVTMKWWDDLWLNEGFATLLERIIADETLPDLDIALGRPANVARALADDSTGLRGAVRAPVEAGSIKATNLAYSKGEAVLDMVAQWMGRDAFQDGVRAYIAAHRWGNAGAADLFEALSLAAGQDVSGPMADFLDRSGYPLLTFEERDSQVWVSQRSCCSDASEAGTDRPWRIPVAVRIEDDSGVREVRTLMEGSELQLDLGLQGELRWLLPASGVSGYYTWQLSSEALDRLLTSGLRTLQPAERIAIVRNLELLREAGDLTVGEQMAALTHFARDEHPVIVRALLRQFDGLGQLRSASEEQAYQQYVRAVLGPAFGRLGSKPLDGEPPTTTSLRRVLRHTLAADGGDESLRQQAQEIASAFLDGHAPASEGDLEFGLTIHALSAPEGLQEQLLERARAEEDPSLRSSLITAAAYVPGPEASRAALDFLLEEQGPGGDFMGDFMGVVMTTSVQGEANRDIAAEWVMSSFDVLSERLPPGVVSQLPWMVGFGCTVERMERLNTFFADPVRAAPGTAESIATNEAAVRACAASQAEDAASMRDYLEAAFPP